jgi:hypothetical protein
MLKLIRADHLITTVYECFSFVGHLSARPRPNCPACGHSITFGEAHTWRFYNRLYLADSLQRQAPCCGASVSLNDLRWPWMDGYARFQLKA